MGRYVRGTQGFSYKLVYGEQPSNLRELAGWAGIDQPEVGPRGLMAQLYAFGLGEDPVGFDGLDAMSNLIVVYESACPPFDLSPYLQQAIDEVCERWQEVIRGIDEYLPGPATHIDLGDLDGYFAFGRADWPRLAGRIGHGADPADPDTIDVAATVLFDSKVDEYLPFMAANALSYAVRNNIETMELFGDRGGVSSNLLEVVADIADPYPSDASWDDRAVHARLRTFLKRDAATAAILRDLLTERPSALLTARALFGVHVWNNDWSALYADADTLLGAKQEDAVRAELLCWRGDAALSLDRSEEARRDAVAAADLGRPELLTELNTVRRPSPP